VYVLGKALGGGILPLSAVAADTDVLGVFTPGTHGSTFGGNPMACAVGRAVIALLRTGEYQERAARLAPRLRDGLEALQGKGLVGVRVVGLWAGIDLDPALGTGRDLCEALMHKGVLTKDTHGSTIRLSPPLTISDDDLDWMLGRLDDALGELRAR
jgi:ornithine--oxo-acid transaminase